MSGVVRGKQSRAWNL